jgi:hypothetical protein
LKQRKTQAASDAIKASLQRTPALLPVNVFSSPALQKNRAFQALEMHRPDSYIQLSGCSAEVRDFPYRLLF